MSESDISAKVRMMHPRSGQRIPPESDLPRYGTLLEMMGLLVQHGSLQELFPELTQRLRRVLGFDIANFALYDPQTRRMRLHLLAEDEQIDNDFPKEDTLSGWVFESQEPTIVSDLRLETRFPPVRALLLDRGILSYCMAPLTTARKKLGALGVGSRRAGAYSQKDLELLAGVADPVALLLENAITRQELGEEKERFRTLVEVNRTLTSQLDLESIFPLISENLKRVLPIYHANLALLEKESDRIRVHVLSEPIAGLEAGMTASRSEWLAAEVMQSGRTKLLNSGDLHASQSPVARQMCELGVKSGCLIPLITSKGAIGTLNLASREDNAFSPQHLEMLQQVASQLAIALENAQAFEEIARLKDKLAEEKLYLEGEIRSKLNCEEVIGDSPLLQRVLAQARTVAPSDATVLILGETGTGKELIARAIHRMSARRDNNFIKVNCAAIPTGLLESELFGHEKGAFTGALARKLGRVQLADKGTLFLDEIGDIPLELQPKLLRVLQEQEFERLGSTQTIRVDLRIIAATNRNLAHCVAQREFRSDLFYRLNVFPIRIPSLRERRRDIPLLVRYFVQKFRIRMNKRIEIIPTETMEALSNWDWLGNVRELENVIERSVILSEGPVLRVPLVELKDNPPAEEAGPSPDTTLEKVQREHILRVLRESGGLISGPNGAAARLGMKRTTLQSRIRRMGIARSEYQG